MNTTNLGPGDQVECCVRGLSFLALVTGQRDQHSGKWPILPNNPFRVTHRFVKPRQIVKKLESGVVG